jgi:hypothetical protein
MNAWAAAATTLLSREHRAEPLGLLPELPVHQDVARLTPEELDERFASHVRADAGPIGVMLHHGVTEPGDMRGAELSAWRARRGRAECRRRCGRGGERA